MHKAHLSRPTPVTRYSDPAYPTLDVHAASPGWLLYHAPPSWLKKTAAISALVSFAAGGATASATEAPAQPRPGGPTIPTEQVTESGQGQGTVTETQAAQVSVAPVFVHGEGRGSSGCVAVAAPVFLSEDEAMEIIMDELRREQFEFDERNHLVCAAEAPGREPDSSAYPDIVADSQSPNPAPPPPPSRPLTVDWYSTKLNLGIEFVTLRDYRESRLFHLFSTVESYDTLELAQRLAETLRNSREINAAVFYDPLVIYSFDRPGRWGLSSRNWKANREEALQEARSLLRAQVRDFVVWAKKELIAKGGSK